MKILDNASVKSIELVICCNDVNIRVENCDKLRESVSCRKEVSMRAGDAVRLMEFVINLTLV